MAYDLELAERIRDCLAAVADLDERKMFGGLAFLIRGNMAVVASGRGGLMVRTGKDAAAELVATTDAEPMQMGDRTMGGWLYLASEHVADEEALERWVARGAATALALPPKA